MPQVFQTSVPQKLGTGPLPSQSEYFPHTTGCKTWWVINKLQPDAKLLKTQVNLHCSLSGTPDTDPSTAQPHMHSYYSASPPVS